MYEILEEIIRDHPVLLNRAPTLHRLGIQAFEPVLVEGKAIRIHPLVCAAFNADFDGDQMAVHVPLSFEAQLEARLLMLSSNNILKPSDGRPVAEPSARTSCSAATSRPRRRRTSNTVDLKTLRRFVDVAEIEMELALAASHAPQRAVLLRGRTSTTASSWEKTTVGRVLFNAIVPQGAGFQNRDMKKKALSELVFESYRRAGLAATVQFLDRLKEFGFAQRHARRRLDRHRRSRDSDRQGRLLEEAEERVERFQRAYQTGNITNGERYNKVIDTWTHANNDIADAMVKSMRESKQRLQPGVHDVRLRFTR